jgi:hypothetical protein
MELSAQIDRCEYLFLTEIQELGCNRLRLIVHEGKPSGKPETVSVAGSLIPDCTPIRITPDSVGFEVEWLHYVAYAVLNESYASYPDASQSYTGRRFRLYTKSHFRDYLVRLTNKLLLAESGLRRHLLLHRSEFAAQRTSYSHFDMIPGQNCCSQTLRR